MYFGGCLRDTIKNKFLYIYNSNNYSCKIKSNAKS